MAITEEQSASFYGVQELLQQSVNSVPECYDRSVKDLCKCPVHSHGIPTIDMNAVDIQTLHSACVEWGFFQIVNHEVSASLMERTKEAVEIFFLLPLEEKLKYKIPVGEFDGYGNVVRGDGKYDWCERIYAITSPKHRRSIFRELPPFLQDTLEDYLTEMQRVVRKLVKMLGESLEIDIAEMFDDGFQSVRLNFYPPCPQPDNVMGLINHSDITGITILNQLNGVNGLEIRKDGEWIKAVVRSDALLVNLGDMFEILSNGVYKSVEHRVMVNSERARISTALFVSPKFEAEIGPMAAGLDSDSPPLFHRVAVEKYVRDFFTRKLAGKSNLDYYRKINV